MREIKHGDAVRVREDATDPAVTSIRGKRGMFLAAEPGAPAGAGYFLYDYGKAAAVLISELEAVK